MADWLGAAIPLISQFNANQNARMNAREARQWEEDMYNKYNSPAAMVRQYEEAGLNPALMYGNAPIAAPTDTAAAETMPPNTGTLTEMLGQLIDLNLFGEEYEGKKLENEEKRVKIQRDKLEFEIQSTFGMLLAEENLNKVIEEINQIVEDTNTTRYTRQILLPLEKVIKENEGKKIAEDVIYERWKNEYIKEYGADPTSDVDIQTLSSMTRDINRVRERLERKRYDKKYSKYNGGGR